MSDHWQNLDVDRRQARIGPWFLFGTMLIIAVGAVLFAAGTWIIRSGQAVRAMDQAETLRFELNALQSQRDELLEQSEELKQQIEALEQNEVALEQELRLVSGELQGVKRDLDATQATLTNDRRVDAHPEALPTADLSSRILDGDGFAVTVSIAEAQRLQLSQGALIEYMKHRLRRAGIATVDESNNRVALSIVAAVSESGHAALSVSLRFDERWKVPGDNSSMTVAIWDTHLVGLTSEDRAAVFVEQLTDSAVEELVRQLHR